MQGVELSSLELCTGKTFCIYNSAHVPVSVELGLCLQFLGDTRS